MRTVKRITVLLIAMTFVLLAGCNTAPANETQPVTLKIGLMPAVDAAPILLAQKMGYFDELGLDVQIEIYTNAQNRQSALQASAIDGAMTDLIAVATNVDSGFDIRAVMMTNGMFPVLMNEGSEDKTDVKVGMMEVSVSNFLIDQWLGESYNIEKVFIDEIPQRLAAIQNGQTDMGLFPEPVASVGELNGLEKKIFNEGDEYCPDVMVFTGAAIENKDDAILLFIQAYNRAVDDISADPGAARDVLMENIQNLDPAVRDMMILPIYTKAGLPDDAYINGIIQWTADIIDQDLAVTPDDLVDRSFTEQ